MKLGFIADNDLPTIETDARFCAEHGLSGLEFNHWGSFSDLTDDYVRRIKAILDKYGVECSTLGLWGWNHTSDNPDERTAALAQLDRLITYGQMLGAPVIITGGGVQPQASLARNLELFSEVFPPYLERMKAAGLRLALYAVHGNTFTNSPEAYVRLWERFPEIGIKCDPANLMHDGWDYLEFLWRHGNKITHMHIKEHLYLGGRLVAQPAAGMGSIEWGKVFCFLHEHAYQGYLTIEPHGEKWSRGELKYKCVTLSARYVQQFLA